jgi:phenylacetate-CoA ligase
MILRQFWYAGTLLRNQWKSREEIEKMQLKRLKAIVDHAYRNTVLYHRKFKRAGIHPSDIQSLRDLRKIPLTTKDEMRKTEEAMARGYSLKNCSVHTTTGSTGKKLKIFYNKDASDLYSALNFRRAVSVGMRLWHVYCPVSNVEGDEPRLSLAEFSRVIPIPGDLNEKAIVALLDKIRPDVLGGHPITVFLVAREVGKQQLDLPLKSVHIGGELSIPEERRLIEDVFNCKTFNKYGSMELRHIAWECSHHGMHMDADNNILEFIKDGEPVAPGEPGEIVGTNLWNRAMPFIRYRQNDIASPSDEICTCGRGLPLLSLLQGRRDDFIIAEGEFIPPNRTVPIFFPLHEIDAFQMIQESLTTLRIKIVKGKGFTDETSRVLTRKVRGVVGDSMEIIIEDCETIQEDTNYRAVISKVKKD